MRFAFIALPRDERNRGRLGAFVWPERTIWADPRLLAPAGIYYHRPPLLAEVQAAKAPPLEPVTNPLWHPLDEWVPSGRLLNTARQDWQRGGGCSPTAVNHAVASGRVAPASRKYS